MTNTNTTKPLTYAQERARAHNLSAKAPAKKRQWRWSSRWF